jgi:hypothetical protein
MKPFLVWLIGCTVWLAVTIPFMAMSFGWENTLHTLWMGAVMTYGFGALFVPIGWYIGKRL